MTNKHNLSDELEYIKQILKDYPNGVLIEQIENQSHLTLSRRALQRRLLELQNLGLIRVEGKTKGTKYFLSSKPSPEAQDLIPLSTTGKRVLEKVNQPLQKRIPVGYNRDFLDQYEPNVTYYLSLKEREKLASVGKTAMQNQPAGTYAKEILNRLLIDLAWNSSRLEGNTYSLLDTQRLIRFGESANDKSAAESQMILNHKDAIEFLVQKSEHIGFNNYTILNLHALLSNNLLPDPEASGRLRIFAVGIHDSVYEPLAFPPLISELFEIILKKAQNINNPFEQAFFIMVHLPYLQPFDDVNKRVSRLAANIPFFRENLAPLSFVDVPNHLYIQGMLGIYEMNHIELFKDVYLWAYERSSSRYAVLRQSLGEPDPFRLKYRNNIYSLIKDIILNSPNPKMAASQIKLSAKELPIQDQEKFIETVETELLSLHDGNFARYQIHPFEFKHWKEKWSL